MSISRTAFGARADGTLPRSPGEGRILIGGRWEQPSTGRTFDSIDPTTGLVLGVVAESGADDVDRAVRAARSAFDGPWGRAVATVRQKTLWDLADLVEAHYEELHELEVLDMGMPVSATKGSAASVELLRYYAGWPTKIEGATIPNSVSHTMLSYTVREPIGVVAAIVPWNSPLRNALIKIGPVLATGCTVILKPAEQASLTALRLGELIQDLDLPPGVINVVTGYGRPVGEALSSHPDVDKVSFTGSTATGQQIVRCATENMKRVSLELGGKSPDIVFADADLDRAVPGAAMGVFRNSGQMCIAGSRIFVQRRVYAEFIERISAFADSLIVGDSRDPKTQIGPLVSQQQMERVLEYIDSGQEEGARVTAGGQRRTEGALAKGYFVPPTVFADVQDHMRICREEIFGAVASILPFDSVDEVIPRANDTNFGLSSGIWTSDIGTAHRFAREVKAGTVWVNTYQAADAAVPFGGYKMSGWGRECGQDSLDSYLAVKSVWIETQ